MHSSKVGSKSIQYVVASGPRGLHRRVITRTVSHTGSYPPSAPSSQSSMPRSGERDDAAGAADGGAAAPRSRDGAVEAEEDDLFSLPVPAARPQGPRLTWQESARAASASARAQSEALPSALGSRQTSVATSHDGGVPVLSSADAALHLSEPPPQVGEGALAELRSLQTMLARLTQQLLTAQRTAAVNALARDARPPPAPPQ